MPLKSKLWGGEILLYSKKCIFCLSREEKSSYGLSFSPVRLFATPMHCSPSGSSVHGISQARILERFAISFSSGSSRSRDQTRVSCIGRQILHHEATREAPYMLQKHRETFKKVIKQTCHWQAGLTFGISVNLWTTRGLPGGSDSKESSYNAGVPGSVPGSGRSPGEGNGNRL